MDRSDGVTPAALIAEAQALGLKAVSKVTFPTMGRTIDAEGVNSKLGACTAVPKGHPLRGSLTDSDGAQASAGGSDVGVNASDACTGHSLGRCRCAHHGFKVKLGQTLLMGDASFKLTRIIVKKPERGAGFISFSPHVMVN